MNFLPNEIRIYAESKKKATIQYVFHEKILWNRNFARRVIYNKPKLVFKNTREDYGKGKNSERRYDSIARSRERIYDIVESNLGIHENPPIFATFTFAENVTDLTYANSCFRLFIRRLAREYRFKPAYLCVVEFQERGAIHYHTVFFNLPYVPVKKFERLWGEGYTNVKAIKRVKNLSAYVCKYLTKETLDRRLVGQKVFFCSRYLARSVEDRDKLNFEEVLTSYPSVYKVEHYNNLTKITYEHKSNRPDHRSIRRTPARGSEGKS